MTRHLLNPRTAKHSELSSLHAFTHAVPLPGSLFQPNHTSLNSTHLTCFISITSSSQRPLASPSLPPAPSPGPSIQQAFNKEGSNESSFSTKSYSELSMDLSLHLDVTSSRVESASVPPQYQFPCSPYGVQHST